jgi:hypothetical protein
VADLDFVLSQKAGQARQKEITKKSRHESAKARSSHLMVSRFRVFVADP